MRISDWSSDVCSSDLISGGSMSEQKKRKIAILGGGVGALTSAFYLASQPGAAEKYEITVYSIGWRLGGKCATGRNPEFGNRIEEQIGRASCRERGCQYG